MSKEVKNMNIFSGADEALKKAGKQVALGIDLGTTNSAISIVRQGRTPETIVLSNGKKTLPSCVEWRGEAGGFVVGMEAYVHRYLPNVIYSVKRFMQETDHVVRLQYKGEILETTPAAISAEILRTLVNEARELYGDCKDVVVTVPALFNQIGINNTKKACELAGLNVLGILREPTSAALCYDITEDSEDVIVYDLGGGTFDLSVVHVTDSSDTNELADALGLDLSAGDESNNKVLNVIANAGDMHLGGDDYDQAIMKILVERIRESGIDPATMTAEERGALLLAIEHSKKLNIKSTHVLGYTVGGGKKKCEVTLYNEDFQEALRPICKKTFGLLDGLVEQYGLQGVKRIILVGGSTKNELLVEALRVKYPDKEIFVGLNPDEVVANGAAIQAKRLKYGDDSLQIFDILPLDLGLDTSKGLKRIIAKNTVVPATNTFYFETIEDNQPAVHLTVVQGKFPVKEDCICLGELCIDGLPEKPAGEVKVSVTLTVDVNCILTCKATVEGQTKELKLSVAATDVKTRTKVDKWLQFAETLDEGNREKLVHLIEEYKAGNKARSKDIQDFIRAER